MHIKPNNLPCEVGLTLFLGFSGGQKQCNLRYEIASAQKLTSFAGASKANGSQEAMSEPMLVLFGAFFGHFNGVILGPCFVLRSRSRLGHPEKTACSRELVLMFRKHLTLKNEIARNPCVLRVGVAF